MRQERKAEEHDDSQFESDTDYDPRDKYYLSGEDDPLDSHLSERRETSRNQIGRDHKSHSRHGSSQPGSSSRSGHTHSRSHGSSHGHHHHHHHHSHRHSHSQSHSHSHSRDLDDDDRTDRQKASAPPSKPSSHASRPRPRPSRASSSYLSAVRRPQVKRAGSSYKTASRTRPRPRPRPVRSLSRNSKQAKPKSNKMPWEDFPWEDAAKVAVQAGGVALMKVGTEQMPWQTKGTKIASAALGAAVVDHVLKPNKRGGVKYAAMRHLAEVAVGNIVVGPALGKVGGGGKKR